jgi:hypothetical protein
MAGNQNTFKTISGKPKQNSQNVQKQGEYREQREYRQYYTNYKNAQINPSINVNDVDVQDDTNNSQDNNNYQAQRDKYKNIPITLPEVPFSKKRKIDLNPFHLLGKLFRVIINFIRLIKNIILTVFTLLVVIILTILFTILYKPAFLWNPLKTFVNNEIVTINTDNVNVDSIYAMINEKAKKESSVTLTESQFSKIAFTQLAMSEINFIRLKKDAMFFYLNIDTQERPLWGIVSIGVAKNEKMKINTFGFGRFDSPQFVSGLLNDTLGSMFSFVENLVTAKNNTFAFNELMDQSKIDKSLSLKEVKIEDGKIVLTYQ